MEAGLYTPTVHTGRAASRRPSYGSNPYASIRGLDHQSISRTVLSSVDRPLERAATERALDRAASALDRAAMDRTGGIAGGIAGGMERAGVGGKGSHVASTLSVGGDHRAPGTYAHGHAHAHVPPRMAHHHHHTRGGMDAAANRPPPSQWFAATGRPGTPGISPPTETSPVAVGNCSRCASCTGRRPTPPPPQRGSSPSDAAQASTTVSHGDTAEAVYGGLKV
mmetsp:Transcript_86485/g.172610  ORF Transcript_86485/g.172610 Transcript_86485/m.172610 type:complete len:223 (+) Transcript_86485:360-1028(+)